MGRLGKLAVFSSTAAALIVACGSRTGLPVDEVFPLDATVDAPLDHTKVDVFDAPHDRGLDAPHDGQDVADVAVDSPVLFDGGPIDAAPECNAPAYCDPKDPGKIWKCGVAIFQCSSIEQCQETGSEDNLVAKCVNPCVDTLGQDTSNGCEFFPVEMDAVSTAAGACYAVFVVNQWKTGEVARIEVSQGGTILPVEQFARIPVGKGTGITYAPYDATKGLAKDQVAILFLSRDPAAANDPDPTAPRRLASCPAGVTPAVVGDAASHGTGRGTAFRVKTNVPVVAYQIFPYGGGRARVTSATLLLPTNVWDNNYMVANAYTNAGVSGTLAIVGQQDNTTVRINPVRAIAGGGGLAGGAPGIPTLYNVNRGEYLQLTQDAELTGSVIQADQPVGVIGGITIMDIPENQSRADTGQQMLPPVRALASEYVGVRYRNRRNRGEEVVPWRIVGAVDGTTLTYDPPQPGAPAAIQSRSLIEFQASGPFVIRSQDAAHPFYLAQYMTGGKISPGGNGTPEQQQDGEGDPEFVNVIAPRQYLSRYTFFTDPTYPETNLVVVRARDTQTGMFPDVTLECAGTLTGWTAVDSADAYEYTRVDLSTGDFQAQGACDNGVHTMTGSFPISPDAGPGPTPRFAVTVWGWGNPITWPPFDNNAQTDPRYTRWVSYGYPAGANITKLNSVIVSAN